MRHSSERSDLTLAFVQDEVIMWLAYESKSVDLCGFWNGDLT